MLILFTSLHVFQSLSRLEMLYLLARLHLFFQQIMNYKIEHFQPHRVGGGGIWQLSVLATQFSVNLKLF